MSGIVRQSVVPIYLFLSLTLGGSAQAVWGNMLLQILGLAIIAWALIEPQKERMTPAAKYMMWLACAAVSVVLLQLVPLPAAIWAKLGAREPIVEGFSLLGLQAPNMPLSLAPYSTIDSLLSAIPPIAVLLGVVRLKAFRPVYAASAIIAGALAGICLSALQVSTVSGGSSPWYLYPVTNIGFGVGFFANVNHMATLLLMSLPFIAALIPAGRGSQIQRFSAFVAITAGLAIVVLVGIGLNRSLAAYALAVPVLLGSLIIVLRGNRRLAAILGAGSVVLLVAAIGAIASSDIGRQRFGADVEQSTRSRAEILGPTLEIAEKAFPFGTGLGTFRPVYAMHEDPDRVTSTYSIHAHNDYAEWALELGLPGLVLIALFFLWWVKASIGVWTAPDASAFARASSVASAAVLAHSIVDFPLRTSAIAACFAFCIAMLADRRAPLAANKGDLRPTRHVVIR